MSRKHFEAIAPALASIRPTPDTPAGDAWLEAVLTIASVCATTNSMFDRARFLEACESRPSRVAA